MAGTITFNTTYETANRVWYVTAGGTVTDRGGVNAVALFPATTAGVGDYVAFAMRGGTAGYYSYKFNTLKLNIAVGFAAASYTGVWEYATRNNSLPFTWKTLTVTDGTNGLSTTGTNTVSFTPPADWYNMGDPLTSSPNGYAYYQFMIRFRITALSGQTAGGITAASASAIQCLRYSIDIAGFTSGAPCTLAQIKTADASGGWGVVTQADSQYTFAAAIYCADTSCYLTTKNEQVQFRNGFQLFYGGVLQVGNLIGGSSVSQGTSMAFESDWCDYSGNHIGGVNSYYYNFTCKHILPLGAASYNGTWGSGSGGDSGCLFSNCYYENWRNLSPSNTGNVFMNITGTGDDLETIGAIVRNVTIAGAGYHTRITAAAKNVYEHQCDLGGATTAPINTYQITALGGPWGDDFVDCLFGAYADSHKVYWTEGASFSGAAADYTMYETYSLQAQVVDANSNPISSTQCYLKNASGTPVFNLAANPDGYIGSDFGTATSGTTGVLNDTGKAWAADAYFYKEILLTSGTGAGQRRIIKKGGTSTQLPAAWNFAPAPASGTKYIIIPYLRTKGYNPADNTTLNASIWSTVNTYAPFTLYLAKYGYIFQTITLNPSAPIVTSYPMAANTFVALSEAAAGALTGISIDPVGKTITVTSNHSWQDVYDYSQWWLEQAANIGYGVQPVTTSDGVHYALPAAWGLTINNCTVTGASKTITVPGTYTQVSGGYFTGVIVASNGTTTQLQLTGLSSHTVYLADGTGAQQDFEATVTGTYTFYLPITATGTWTWVVKKAGSKAATGNFSATVGGIVSVAVSTPQDMQPSGAAMYQGTSDANCTVSFTGTTEADIVIGNATVTNQAAYDTTERALITLAGMQWLAGAKSDTSIATLIAGNFLFMTSGWRLIALNGSCPNAAIGAFVISTDGTPVNGANGPVAFLSSAQLTQADVVTALGTFGALKLTQFMALK